jgi:hypothetical protein
VQKIFIFAMIPTDYGTPANSFASGLSGKDWRSSLYIEAPQ